MNYKTIYVYRNGAFLFNISCIRSLDVHDVDGVAVLIVDGVHLGFRAGAGFRFAVETW